MTNRFGTSLLNFWRSDSGAVTVDWVVLTGATVGLGIATAGAIALGTSNLSGDVSEFMGGQSIVTSFNSAFSNIVYFDDFENGMAPGWSVQATDNSEPAFGGILGPFGGTSGQQMVFKTYDLNPDAEFAVVEFDLHAIDTWDMEVLSVFVNDLVATQRNFSTHGTHPSQQVEINTTDPAYTVTYAFKRDRDEYGYWQRGDASSHDETVFVRIEITDPGDTLKLGFGSTLNQALNDESWAVDNVKVTSTDDMEST